MFKKKGLFKVLLLAMISVLMLSACGTKDESDSSSGSSKNNKNTLEAIKEKDKIVFGVKNDTRLFGLKDPKTGNIAGFDIDIAKEITKIILGDESKAEFKEVTSKTRIPLLQKGDIDAIVATMTITEERKQEVDFSDVYFEAGQSLLVKKGSSIKSIKDIKKGTKVLAVKGSTSAVNIHEKAPDATVLEFENYAEAFTALKAKQGDTLTTDNAILYGMVDEDPSYQVVGDIFTDEPYGIAMKKDSPELVKAINDALKELKDNGKYDELYNKWIKTSN